MNKPRGYTILEIMTALAIIFVIILVAVVIINPFSSLEDAYREQQLDDIGDYMEAFLQLKEQDETAFYEMILQAKGDPVMIGNGENCAGYYGIYCYGPDFSGICLDPNKYLGTDLLFSELPYDSADSAYSDYQTGYYMVYKEDVLEIGACGPSGAEYVRLMSLIK